jgi:hypothetical protein
MSAEKSTLTLEPPVDPPIARPSKIIAGGLNYRDHAAESQMDLPDRPLLFAKWPNSLIGDGDAIRIPPESAQVDFEAELGVVIGQTSCGPVPVSSAFDLAELHVARGDVVRAGTALVPASSVPDPQALRIRCLLQKQGHLVALCKEPSDELDPSTPPYHGDCWLRRCEPATALSRRFPCNSVGFSVSGTPSSKDPESPRKVSNLSPKPSPNETVRVCNSSNRQTFRKRFRVCLGSAVLRGF